MKTMLLIGCILFAGFGNLLLKDGMDHVGNFKDRSVSTGTYVLRAALRPETVPFVVEG